MQQESCLELTDDVSFETRDVLRVMSAYEVHWLARCKL